MKETRAERFGNFLRSLMEEHGRGLRETARDIEVSAPYLSEVLSGKRIGMTSQRLDMLSHSLGLSDIEKRTMYDLSAEARSSNEVRFPQDCADYVTQNDYVLDALRIAKDHSAGAEEWQRFIRQLQEKAESV